MIVFANAKRGGCLENTERLCVSSWLTRRKRKNEESHTSFEKKKKTCGV